MFERLSYIVISFLIVMSSFAGGDLTKVFADIDKEGATYRSAGQLFKLQGDIEDDDMKQAMLKAAAVGLIASDNFAAYSKNIACQLDDAAGFEASLKDKCGRCGGSGKAPCSVCKGSRRCNAANCRNGHVVQQQVVGAYWKTCPNCHGTALCPKCKGSGVGVRCMTCGGTGRCLSRAKYERVFHDNMKVIQALYNGTKQVVDVIVTGRGATVEDARKNALKSAVESVVGTVIDATTVVENDELTEDKAQFYSAGVVQSAKTIGEVVKGEDGIYTIIMKVAVKKNGMSGDQRRKTTKNMEIDGDDLFANAESLKENLDESRKMIDLVLSKYSTVFDYEIVLNSYGKPLDYDPDSGNVFVTVRGFIDREKYRKWVVEILEKIEPMAIGKAVTRGEIKNGDFRVNFPKECQGNCLSVVHDWDSCATTHLFLNESLAKYLVSWPNNRVWVTDEGCLVLGICVILKDEAGNVLVERTLPKPDSAGAQYLGLFLRLNNGRDHFCTVFPAWNCYTGIANGGSVIRFRSSKKNVCEVKFDLGKFTLEKLKHVKNVNIEIGLMVDNGMILK